MLLLTEDRVKLHTDHEHAARHAAVHFKPISLLSPDADTSYARRQEAETLKASAQSGGLGRGEDAHEGAAHILISTLFSPSRQESGGRRATRQDAPLEGKKQLKDFTSILRGVSGIKNTSSLFEKPSAWK